MSVWFVFFMSISLFAGVCFAPDILGMPMGKGPDVFLQVLSVLCMLFFAGSLFLGAKAKKIYKVVLKTLRIVVVFVFLFYRGLCVSLLV